MRIRNVSLFLITLALSALILAAGAYVVIASPGVRAPATLGPSAVSSSMNEWSSGWIPITPGQSQLLIHGLGLPPDRYGVEMWFQDTDGGKGINRRYYGGVEINGQWQGAHWQNLTANTIRVYRQPDDQMADMVNVNIRVIPPSAGGYSSTWTTIAPSETLPFTHSIGYTETNLWAIVWFSGNRGINHYAYGGLTWDGVTGTQGAFWHNMTSQTVQVTRFPSDTEVGAVKVFVISGTVAPDFEQTQTITPDLRFTFTHNLNWNPDMLTVRGECQDATLGMHQHFAGGDHTTGAFRGANLENLTANEVIVYRRGQDQTCSTFHIRIWKRSAYLYMPAVLKDYQ